MMRLVVMKKIIRNYNFLLVAISFVIFILVFPNQAFALENEESAQTDLITTDDSDQLYTDGLLLPEGTEIDEDGELTLNSENLYLKVILPKEFAGYKFTVKDSIGVELGSGQIDLTGKAEIETLYPTNTATLYLTSGVINTSEPQNNNRTYSLEEVAIYLALTVLLISIIFFFIGRRSVIQILDDLRDYIYEEDLD